MIHLLAIGLAIACTYFGATWAVSVTVRNYGFLDVAWSYGVAILAPLYAWLGPGEPVRKWVLTVIGAAWSLRLGTHILRRVLRHHPKEDARYETLRKRWPGAGMFLAFFELQAVLVVIFSLPFLFMAFDVSRKWHPLTVTGLILAIVALGGETLADWQVEEFKKRQENCGKICQEGLWYYSRHPNYFFEFSIWVAFATAALPAPHGWLAVSCPLLMLYFLLKVTGIPLTEEYSVRSKGAAYREYQRTTSAFIPWFKKS